MFTIYPDKATIALSSAGVANRQHNTAAWIVVQLLILGGYYGIQHKKSGPMI
jgi:hypothetical protein